MPPKRGRRKDDEEEAEEVSGDEAPATQRRGNASQKGRGAASQADKGKGKAKRQRVEDDDDEAEGDANATQASQGRVPAAQRALEKMTAEEVEQRINEAIRFALFTESRHTSIKRADLSKSVMREHGRATGAIIDAMQKRLEDTFGARLEPVPGNAAAETAAATQRVEGEGEGAASQAPSSTAQAKAYFLLRTDKIGDEADLVASEAELPRTGLLTVVLIMIRMSKNALPEQKLWEVLNKLGLQKGRDGGVGDPDKALKEFERQQYIDKVKISDGAADNAGGQYEYRLGARAKVELESQDIVRMAAEIYEADPDVWLRQLEPKAKRARVQA